MLLLDGPLTFREYMTNEDVPLAAIFKEVLSFLAAREDAVLFGAQAVNAYCDPPRMTGDVDVLSTQAAALADTLRTRLAARFHIATRVREVVPQLGFRVYQVRKPKNRHLVDVRQTDSLPPSRRIEGVQVAAPVDLLAMKVVSIDARRGQEKELSDRLDAVRLLRTFPELKVENGEVSQRLQALGAENVLPIWRELVQQQFDPGDDDDGY